MWGFSSTLLYATFTGLGVDTTSKICECHKCINSNDSCQIFDWKSFIQIRHVPVYCDLPSAYFAYLKQIRGYKVYCEDHTGYLRMREPLSQLGLTWPRLSIYRPQSRIWPIKSWVWNHAALTLSLWEYRGIRLFRTVHEAYCVQTSPYLAWNHWSKHSLLKDLHFILNRTYSETIL